MATLDNKEPVTLDQGENFVPQDAIFSTKDDLMAVASWYQNQKQSDKDLSMVKLYDVTTLKDKVYYFVPGKVSSGSRREPHESTFFVDDNNVMLLHTKVKDGFNTYLIDGRQSNYIAKTVEHHSNVTRLFELCGGYFAATRTDGVVIFDIRNLRRSIEILGRIQNPTHVALNPVKPGSHAIIAAGSALHTYMGTTEKK